MELAIESVNEGEINVTDASKMFNIPPQMLESESMRNMERKLLGQIPS